MECEDPLKSTQMDAYREDLDADGAAIVVELYVAAVGLVGEAEHPAAAREEMTSIVEGVEADDVSVEEGAKNLLADGEGAVDL